MKQLSLPISSRAISTIFKLLVGLLIFGGLVGVFMYYYFVYTKDSFAEFFPLTTKAYVSLKLQPSQETDDLIKKIIPEIDFQEALSEVVKKSEGSLKSRTIAFGLVPMDGKDEVLIIFDQPLGFSSLMMEYANKRNWSVYEASYGWSGKSQLIVTSNPKVYELVSKVVVDESQSLSDNLTNELALNSAISQSGTLYLDPQYILEILKAYDLNTNIFDLGTKPYIGGIRSFYPNLIVQSDGYSEPLDVEIYDSSITKYNFGDFYDQIDRKKIDEIKKNLKLVGLDEKFEEFIKNRLFSSLSYNYLHQGWIYELYNTDSESVDDVVDFIHKYLANTYLKSVEVVLPDKSIATMNAINDDIKVTKLDNQTIFEVPGLEQVISVVDFDKMVEVRFLSGELGQKVKIEGCKANISNDYLYLSNPQISVNNFVLKLAKNIFLSTYSQAYPQFIICARM